MRPAVPMDLPQPSSHPPMETYRDFQWERAPTRLRQLVWLGLGLTPLLLVLDVLTLRLHGAPLGTAVFVRLPWALVPLGLLLSLIHI